MRTTQRTILALNEFAQQIGINPWFLAQLGDGYTLRATQKIQQTIYQHTWQNVDTLSREEIARAINDAEREFAGICNYWPGRTTITNEQVTVARYHTPEVYPTGRTWRGNLATNRTQYRYIRTVGTVVATEIDDEVAVTPSDPMGDGFNTTWTATVTVPAGTLAEEIHCYFVAADRGDLQRQDSEIRRVFVSIDGTTATITGKMYLLVKPTLQEKVTPDVLSVATAANFATNIMVYREAVDLAQGGRLEWMLGEDCDYPPCSYDASTACFALYNAELGLVRFIPAEYNATTEQFARKYPDHSWRQPDRIFINYVCGYADDSVTGWMDRTHARAIALLAASRLPNKTMGAERADQVLHYWQRPPTAEEPIAPEVLETYPFGEMRRGAIQAWTLMRNFDMRKWESVSIG